MNKITICHETVRAILCPMALAMLTAACQGKPEPAASLAELLGNPANHALKLQGTGLSMVVAARFTESGSRLVVLDAVPPFIKVFDREGNLRRSFIQRGGGPEEMFGPSAIATKGDSLLLIVDGTGTVREYSLEGTQLASARIAVRVITAAASCGSKWFLYGMRVAGEPKETQWIHELSFEGARDSVSLQSWFAQPPSPGWSPVLGRPHGSTEADGRVTFFMDFTAPPLVGDWDCAAQALDSTPIMNWKNRIPASEGDGTRLAIAPGTRVSSGVVRVGNHRILSAFELNGQQSGSQTVFRILKGSEDFSVIVPGTYILLDAKPAAGILVLNLDGVQLFAVDQQRFLNAVEPAK